MPENLLESLCSVVAESNLSSTHPERERLQILVIGSRDGVMETIHTLHARGFAEVGAWSPLLPTPHLSEVMSILRRYRKRDN